MKRLTSGFLAAAETVFAALTGLGIAFVPLVLLWAVQFHLQPDLALFTRAAANTWLLGHGVDLRVVIDPSLTAGLTVPGANAPFVISLAPLGFALVTAAAGWRIGYRALTRRELVVTGAIAVSGYAVIGGVLGLLVGTTAAQPDTWQSLLLPPLVMMTGVLAGACRGRWSDWERENRSRTIGQPGDWRLYPLLARAGFRAGRIAVTAVVGILGVAALLVTFSVVVNYATMVGLAGSLGAQGRSICSLRWATYATAERDCVGGCVVTRPRILARYRQSCVGVVNACGSGAGNPTARCSSAGKQRVSPAVVADSVCARICRRARQRASTARHRRTSGERGP